MGKTQREPRLVHNARILIRDTKGKIVFSQGARMHNIGANGFGFLGDEELTRGLVYQFEIFLGRSPLRALGKVVHKRIEIDHFTYGIRFIKVPMIGKARLARFLSEKLKRFRLKAFIISFLFIPFITSAISSYADFPMWLSLLGTAIVGLIAYLILPY